MARTILASFLVLMLAFPTAFGTDFTVGDSGGWTLGTDYSTWAAGKSFKVGDNLVFNYDSNHALDEVNANGYNGCSSSNSIKSYQDGNTKIALSSPGKRYFLCPKPGHCSGGMKLEVNVVAASSTPPTTPSGSPPTTPSTASPPSESGTPATSTTPPSPKPNGANTVSSAISLLVGSFFVSAIMFGFMG
ncbi:uclacyanin-3-like [Abrus precatorius]|uniref:Uclacyanin-3-like n=1 Tax=Abrus precatorius TaxID=3816 RepID=A0A8B8JZA7_ABRPR|nr:uclacyanin-3-like [Abrus precatorius]